MTDHKQEEAIRLLIEAGVLTPSTTKRNKTRHQRAVFKNDVRPFASGIGWALAIMTAGLTISAAALVTVIFRAAGLFAEDQTLLQVETFVVAAGAAAGAYGAGYTWQMRDLVDSFNQRLFHHDEELTHFQPTNNNKQPAVFLKLDDHRTTRIPPEIPTENLARFLNAILNDKATLSESSAAYYDINRSAWETFRSWALEINIIRWKDEANHRLGLEVAGPAGRAAIRTVAMGYYREKGQ